MPQLDTSTWFVTVLSSTITLFILFQLKMTSQIYPNSPTLKHLKTLEMPNPWETKWTKTYSPLSLPLH